MTPVEGNERRTVWAYAVPMVIVLAATACGAPSTDTAGTGTARSTQAAAHGTVDVLYAGSLVQIMEQQLGPRFTAATGYGFAGFAGGSEELGHDIESGVRRGDVFVSASPDVDQSLQGAAAGRWVTWYATFARSPLVIGYAPGSRFASALRTRPWYEVVTSPGFLLGRTDPELDPKGQLTVDALRDTAQRTGDRSLLQVLDSTATVFPEETLLGRLEAGQLDAAFLYEDEAKSAGIPTVRLSPVSLSTTYTVTVLRHAPDGAGGVAFVRFLLGSEGRRTLTDAGLEVLDPPELHGSGAPGSLVRATAR